MTKFQDSFIPPDVQLIQDPLTKDLLKDKHYLGYVKAEEIVVKVQAIGESLEALAINKMTNITPPRPLTESKTFCLTKAMVAFSRIVAAAAFFSEAGIMVLLPKESQAIANTVLLVVGVLAMLLGIEDKGKKIVLERLSKPDVYTPLGKLGNNAETAKHAVYLDRSQLQIAKEALRNDITII
jgi:hypothetical protein